jgi:hypothetical protein
MHQVAHDRPARRLEKGGALEIRELPTVKQTAHSIFTNAVGGAVGGAVVLLVQLLLKLLF